MKEAYLTCHCPYKEHCCAGTNRSSHRTHGWQDRADHHDVDHWTSVSFKPDLAKFHINELETNTVALIRKRVYDLAGILGKGVVAGTTATTESSLSNTQQAAMKLPRGGRPDALSPEV